MHNILTTKPPKIDAFPDNAYTGFSVHVEDSGEIYAILELKRHQQHGHSNHRFTLKELTQRLEIFDIEGEDIHISQRAIDAIMAFEIEKRMGELCAIIHPDTNNERIFVLIDYKHILLHWKVNPLVMCIKKLYMV